VASGFVGLGGLLWLLALRPDASMTSRRIIRAMIVVGIAGLLNLPES
jgi:hypothetical protein